METDEVDLNAPMVNNWGDVFSSKYAFRFDLKDTFSTKGWYYSVPDELSDYDFDEDKFHLKNWLDKPRFYSMVVGNFSTGEYAVLYGDLGVYPAGSAGEQFRNFFGPNGELVAESLEYLKQPIGSSQMHGIQLLFSDGVEIKNEGGER